MDNTGGLRRIWVCPADCLDGDGRIADRAKMVDIPFVEDTASRKCVRKHDKTGVYYEVTVVCRLARSERDGIAERFPVDYVLVTTDWNGVTRVDGTADEPMHFEAESDTGEKFEDLNGVDFKFSRKLRLPSAVI